MNARTLLVALLTAAVPAMLVNACSDEEVNASGTGASAAAGSTNGSASGGAGAEGTGGNNGGASSGGAGTAGSGACTPGATQCTDCIDNDNDGQTDSWDVECVGPLDNDEGSFATGIPGDNSDPCKQDCFFDGDSGSGNDGCLWDLSCDPKNPGAPDCPYDPDNNNCPGPQSQKCIDNCFGYTPNGCDCFGCCEITLADKTTVTIKLSPGCTEETATDPAVCKPCTQVRDCFNPCEPCEYCLGKTELPPECDKDGGMGGNGGTGGNGGGCDPCAPEFPCGPGEYCLTGCCVPQ